MSKVFMQIYEEMEHQTESTDSAHPHHRALQDYFHKKYSKRVTVTKHGHGAILVNTHADQTGHPRELDKQDHKKLAKHGLAVVDDDEDSVGDIIHVIAPKRKHESVDEADFDDKDVRAAMNTHVHNRKQGRSHWEVSGKHITHNLVGDDTTSSHDNPYQVKGGKVHLPKGLHSNEDDEVAPQKLLSPGHYRPHEIGAAIKKYHKDYPRED